MNQKESERRGTYRRTKYVEDKYLMDWIGGNLPPANTGFYATDLDLILRNSKGDIMLLETKRKAAGVKNHQNITFQILDRAMKAISGQTLSIKLPDGRKVKTKVNYRGFKLLQFENTTFEDGRTMINGKQRTEEEVRQILSFNKKA